MTFWIFDGREGAHRNFSETPINPPCDGAYVMNHEGLHIWAIEIADLPALLKLVDSFGQDHYLAIRMDTRYPSIDIDCCG